jgi:hypothetical protein
LCGVRKYFGSIATHQFLFAPLPILYFSPILIEINLQHGFQKAISLKKDIAATTLSKRKEPGPSALQQEPVQ